VTLSRNEFNCKIQLQNSIWTILSL
jgi:hypothetical protein